MRPRRVAVLGAGLSGLAAAYELRKRSGRRQPPPEVVVFEAASRVGGNIRSESHEGVAYEAGPATLSMAQPEVLELVRELGLGHELVHADRRSRAVLIYGNGRMWRLPEGAGRFPALRWGPLWNCDLLTWKGKLRLWAEPWAPREDDERDESLAAFFLRRTGPEAARMLAEPILAGAWAGDAAHLSLRSAFPQFLELERPGRGPRPAVQAQATALALRGGLAALPQALARRLPPGCLRLGSAVTGICRRNGGWEVHGATGREIFDAVISGLPAPDLAGVVGGIDPELAGVLREIPFCACAVAVMAYEKADFSFSLDASCLLVPRCEGRPLVRAGFISAQFPSLAPSSLVLVRAELGGAGREAAALAEEAQVARLARGELRDILGLGAAHPRWTRVARWTASRPQYTVGHELRLRRLESCLRAYPGLVLAGQSYRGVDLSHSARSGRLAADQLLASPAGRLFSGVV